MGIMMMVAAALAAAPGEAPALLERVERRNASGTAWQPEATPMYALMGEAGGFDWMAHANVFAFYDVQGSSRGDSELGSVNWGMASVTRPVGRARLGARAMMSLEPLTVGPEGYPLLAQTGETWQGAPLTDRQHPHDLFMEAAVLYRQAIGTSFGFELYVAPAGEPAIGPVAFPHRASALADPLAPLGHHWQDATHISYGVVTGGLFTALGKLEGSWFNGREPDEDRYGFDLRVPDSGAVRLTVAPGASVAAQASYAYLAEPEALHPGDPVHRLTASVGLDRPVGAAGGRWATTAAWGRNVERDAPTDSALLESTIGIGQHVNVYGRAEYVVKRAEDLGIADVPHGRRYGVAALSLGHVFAFEPVPSWTLGLGLRGSVTALPEGLAGVYGGRFPLGGVVYVQAHPARHEMEASPAGPPHGH